MDDQWQDRTKTSVWADMGPLPEVVETDSESLWRVFVELNERHTAGFLKTAPSSVAALGAGRPEHDAGLSVEVVMAEARRHNRVCPTEAEWQRLHTLLASVAADAPPPPLKGIEYRRSAPLVRRIRVRDQVEWAAQHGLLPELFSFIESLPEDQWVHMGD